MAEDKVGMPAPSELMGGKQEGLFSIIPKAEALIGRLEELANAIDVDKIKQIGDAIEIDEVTNTITINLKLILNKK